MSKSSSVESSGGFAQHAGKAAAAVTAAVASAISVTPAAAAESEKFKPAAQDIADAPEITLPNETEHDALVSHLLGNFNQSEQFEFKPFYNVTITGPDGQEGEKTKWVKQLIKDRERTKYSNIELEQVMEEPGVTTFLVSADIGTHDSPKTTEGYLVVKATGGIAPNGEPGVMISNLKELKVNQGRALAKNPNQFEKFAAKFPDFPAGSKENAPAGKEIVLPTATDHAELLDQLYNNVNYAFRTGDTGAINVVVCNYGEIEGKDTELGQLFASDIEEVQAHRADNNTWELTFNPTLLASNGELALYRVDLVEKFIDSNRKSTSYKVVRFRDCIFNTGDKGRSINWLDTIEENEALALSKNPALLLEFEPVFDEEAA